MARLNLFLFVTVLASALFLVHKQYQSRVLYTALHRAVAETRQLDTEHDRLQVEKRAQATPLRVETLARTKLDMRSATPAITRYISQPEGAALGLAAGRAAAGTDKPASTPAAGTRPDVPAGGRVGSVQ